MTASAPRRVVMCRNMSVTTIRHEASAPVRSFNNECVTPDEAMKKDISTCYCTCNSLNLEALDEARGSSSARSTHKQRTRTALEPTALLG